MKNSFQTLSTFKVGSKSFYYYSLKKFEKNSGRSIAHLPYSLKILLENLLRREDGTIVRREDILAICDWDPKAEPDQEIQFMPARILLQDFTGVPCVADLAAMRKAMKRLGGDPNRINPLQPVDLVVDHSVQVDFFGTPKALEQNTKIEFTRNSERYQFLRWGQKAFKNFRVVPPETGIVHQVNLEYLSFVAMQTKQDGKSWIYPDSLIGTDSHTTMINGLGVLGWGVGGIEAEAAMLGQPVTMLIPQVVGMKLEGKIKPGVTATDLVLTVTEILRKKGVVGKFVEFFGPGLSELTLADRATIANMAPEYGATVGLFPVDDQTTDYLKLTGRTAQASIVKSYFQNQNLWGSKKGSVAAHYTDVVTLRLDDVSTSLAGPSRPQDRINLGNVSSTFQKALPSLLQGTEGKESLEKIGRKDIDHGSVVMAAITSCTNTSNPSNLMTAGLLARNAVKKGLQTKPWVKTSLAPGSKVVTSYFKKAGLSKDLEALKFHTVGYGCTTCIGNSGPLPKETSDAISSRQLAVAAVLSGNRNFEGRIHPHIRANYLASPPLVVAYALAGNVNINLETEPLGKGKNGKSVFLKDIWPTPKDIKALVKRCVTSKLFKQSYSNVFKGDKAWQKLKFESSPLYAWSEDSTYIKEPPFFDPIAKEPAKLTNIKGARVLAYLGDSVTTDHISPAGNISKNSPAGQYLQSQGVQYEDFNSYGARRGNHEVMIRGTFANNRLKNRLTPGVEGGVTQFFPTKKQMTIYDAAMEYQKAKTDLVILAGKEYGTGSSRDWAAKGTKLLGVRAVIAESFERIHRSNLVGMGVLPLQFINGENAEKLGLTGEETIQIAGLDQLRAAQNISVIAVSPNGNSRTFTVKSRIDTPNEVEYYRHGGILPYVLRQILNHG